MQSELAVRRKRIDRLRWQIMSLVEFKNVDAQADREKEKLLKMYRDEISIYVEDVTAAYGILSHYDERTKQIFELRYIDGLSWNAVAEEAGFLERRELTKYKNYLEYIFKEHGRPDLVEMVYD